MVRWHDCMRVRPADSASSASGSGSVRSERGSPLLGTLPNRELDFRFGSGPMPDFGPDFGPVRKSSGPNRGSEPDCGITSSAVSSWVFPLVRYQSKISMRCSSVAFSFLVKTGIGFWFFLTGFCGRSGPFGWSVQVIKLGKY